MTRRSVYGGLVLSAALLWVAIPGGRFGSRVIPDTPLDGQLLEGLAEAPQPSTNDEVDCMALTLYWEARTEGRDGMLAVGWVVLNRMEHPEFPNRVCDVVRQGGEVPGCQFSYWCDGKSDTPRDPVPWALARSIARELLSNPPPDPTGGALFFHADYVSGVEWAPSLERTVQIGTHVYYK